MSTRIETVAATRNAVATNKNKEDKSKNVNVIGFDAERFQSPFALRCGALLIDYLIVVAAPAITFLLASRSNSGVKFWRDSSLSVGWLIAILIVVTNFVILPVATGRTIGKFVTGLSVVCKDGGNLSFTSAALRHLIGYPLTLLTGGLGFAVAAFNRKGRALHDFLAGTIVVQARRRVQTSKPRAK